MGALTSFLKLLKPNRDDYYNSQTEQADNWQKIDDWAEEVDSKCPFPVGGIYLSMDTTDPSTFWPNSTWVKVENGRFLRASDTAGATGGSTKITENNIPQHNHSTPPHSHTGTTEGGGSHSHTRGSMNITGSVYSGGSHGLIQQSSGSISGAFTTGTARGRYIEGYSSQSWDLNFDASKGWTGSTSTQSNHSHSISINGGAGTSGSTGSSTDYHQPYLEAVMWQRTA